MNALHVEKDIVAKAPFEPRVVFQESRRLPISDVSAQLVYASNDAPLVEFPAYDLAEPAARNARQNHHDGQCPQTELISAATRVHRLGGLVQVNWRFLTQLRIQFVVGELRPRGHLVLRLHRGRGTVRTAEPFFQRQGSPPLALSPVYPPQAWICHEDRLDEIADRPESFPLDVEPVRFARVQ